MFGKKKEKMGDKVEKSGVERVFEGMREEGGVEGKRGKGRGKGLV